MKKSPLWSQTLQWGLFRVKSGLCAAAWTPHGLCGLALPQKNRKMALKELRKKLPPLPVTFWEKKSNLVSKIVRIQAQRAFNGNGFKLPLFDISFLTNFQQRILKATCHIPWGQVRNYGWVAKKAGSSKGFRAAGQALHRNPIPLFIPCHRVIASDGHLGGYGGGLEWKKTLLKNECLAVNGDGKVVTEHKSFDKMKTVRLTPLSDIRELNTWFFSKGCHLKNSELPSESWFLNASGKY